MKPIYGVGYEPLGDLADFVDPFGIRKITGKISDKVDHWVDARAGKAAAVAEQRVEAGVKRAIGDSAKTALVLGGGAVLAALLAGGVYWHVRQGREDAR
jgi:hypothetical protein